MSKEPLMEVVKCANDGFYYVYDCRNRKCVGVASSQELGVMAAEGYLDRMYPLEQNLNSLLEDQ